MKNNFTKEQLEHLYLKEEKTASEIAKLFNVSTITIQRWLHKYNLRKMDIIPSDICDKEKVREMIYEGMTHKKIANYYNITLYQLRGYLRNHVTNQRSNHEIDESLIDVNNPMFWYLIGLISTDGHLNSVGNTVSIYQKDAVFLNKLKNYFKSKGFVRRGNSGIYILYLTSEKLTRFLKEQGFTSDKRYSVPFLKCPEKHLPLYIRGIFDGDGCISYKYLSGILKSRVVQITSGSYSMIQGIEKSCNFINFKIHAKKSIVNNPYWDILATTVDDIVKFCEFIYSEGYLEYCLTRKLVLFKRFLKIIEIDKMVI